MNNTTILKTANNGLTSNNGKVKFGGILTGDTFINGAGNNLNLAFTTGKFQITGTTFNLSWDTTNKRFFAADSSQVTGGTYNYTFGLDNRNAGSFGSVTFGESSEITANGGDSMVCGEGSYVDAYGGKSFARGGAIRVGGDYGFIGGGWEPGFTYGKTNNKVPQVSGFGSFGWYTTDNSQTANHGLSAAYSAILAGFNHDIPSNSIRSVILGGNQIKAVSGITDTVYLPKVRIGRGVGGSLTTGSTSQNFLVLDETTGEIQIADVNFVTGNSTFIVENTLSQLGLKKNLKKGVGHVILTNGSAAVTGVSTNFLDASITGMSYWYQFWVYDSVLQEWFYTQLGSIADATNATIFTSQDQATILSYGFQVSGSSTFQGTSGTYEYYINNSVSQGVYSFVESVDCIAVGTAAHAEGQFTVSSGNYAHAEGQNAMAIGSGSHAEGQQTKAINIFAHAEGSNTIASGTISHAEGQLTIASGADSHAENYLTRAIGDNSHAEGVQTVAFGVNSHAEGELSSASGDTAHAEGSNTIAFGAYSHSQGCGTVASGYSSHSGGAGSPYPTLAFGSVSFNHSYNNTGQTAGHGAIADYSVILGGRNHNIASGSTNSVVLGGDTIKAASGVTNTVFLPKVRFGLGNNASLTTNNSNSNLLARNNSTGEIEIVHLTGSSYVNHTLFDHYSSIGNSGTTETDLYSDSLTNILVNNGDKIEAEYGGTFVSSGTATRQIKIYFGGSIIFDTGALTLSLSSAWTSYVTIIRVSSSVVRYMISLTTEGAALSAYTSVGELTGLTLSGSNVFKITGTAAGVGAATNDIVAFMGTGQFKPKG